jgi:CBS domain-containing protein
VAQARVLDTIVVKEVMTTEVITTTPDTPLRDAARVMAERKLGCLPVCERGRLVGIVTEGDFVALALRD